MKTHGLLLVPALAALFPLAAEAAVVSFTQTVDTFRRLSDDGDPTIPLTRGGVVSSTTTGLISPDIPDRRSQS